MHGAANLALRAVASRHRREVLVSVAHHVRGMRPARPESLLDGVAAALPDLVLNRWWLDACREGRSLFPVGLGQRVPGVAGSLDYIGLNYYTDDLVAFDWRRPDVLFSRGYPDPSLPLSTYGWAIDATGLRRTLLRLWDEFHLPIVVTENGVADSDDELRPGYLVEHLAAVHAAMREGVDVRGYLHWTGMDNFEWAEGFGQRFGLYAVDRVTMERRAKPSARLFARICASRGIPADLLVSQDLVSA
jgi:beta-glucosidase